MGGGRRGAVSTAVLWAAGCCEHSCVVAVSTAVLCVAHGSRALALDGTTGGAFSTQALNLPLHGTRGRPGSTTIRCDVESCDTKTRGGQGRRAGGQSIFAVRTVMRALKEPKRAARDGGSEAMRAVTWEGSPYLGTTTASSTRSVPNQESPKSERNQRDGMQVG